MAKNWNIRPDEKNNDHDRIKRQVETFLRGDGLKEGVESNTSEFSPLEVDSALDVLGDVGAINALTLDTPKRYSGAYSAVLPMEFAIGDRNGNRLQFQMLINPNTLNVGMTSTVNNNYTREGYVTQVWGTNQLLITSNGTTAAFIIEGEGLTNVGRRRSLAYGNYLAFLYTYRNNGYQFSDPTALKEQLTRVINVVNGVEMYYDNHWFMGHFNNFTMDENAERPFLFDYNFEFVISSRSNNYNEVRGHFKPLPENEVTETGNRILNDLQR